MSPSTARRDASAAWRATPSPPSPHTASQTPTRYIGSGPEDAVFRGRPAKCDAVRFRVDTLRVSNELGSVEVELGERQELAPGESYRVVYSMDPRNGADQPTYEMDLMGFRFRAEKTSPHCSLVATGLFFADADTSVPIPFALIPSVGPEPRGNLQCGQ